MSDKLTQLRLRDFFVHYPGDVDRMRRILNDRGYDASTADIQAAYESHSDRYGEKWMFPDRTPDDHLFAILMDRLVEDEP